MAMFLLGLVAGTENTSAQQLTDGTVSAITQSTASDSDAVFLYLSAGYQVGQLGVPTQDISFNSTTTATSWTGTLSGLYLGEALNLAYANGTNTAGTVSWNTTGTFGGGSVTGGGTSAISYPTSSTFDLTFSDTLGYGGNTYAVNYDIPGSINADGTFMFGSLEDEEVGDGTWTLDGSPIAPLTWYSGHDTEDGGVWISDINGRGLPWWWWYNKDRWGKNPQQSTTFTTDGDIYNVVPEPTSVALLAAGALGLMMRVRRTR
jgi:hypothetical protein